MSDYYALPGTADLYCDFHYGPEHFGVANLNRAIVDFALPHAARRRTALDVGCAVGRAALELARHFEQVLGVDLSRPLVERAESVRAHGEATWERVVEGPIRSRESARLASFGLSEAASRVQFQTADAAAAAELGSYDLVLACNLVDRVPDPLAVVGALAAAVAPGGCLVIASPFTWLEEYTPPDRFLARPGVTSWERLAEALAPECDLLAGPADVEFVIRETQRKFQHSFAQAGVWRKRA